MARPPIRPRFRIPVNGEAEDARRRVQRALENTSCRVRGGRIGQRLELRMPEEERRYWSPHLSLVIDAEDDGSIVAEGRFGPHPHVWTLFVALYAHVIFLAIAAVMYGLSQWLVGQDPWALWGIPLSLALTVIVYLSAFYGQGLGRDQMHHLQSFVERALASAPDGAPRDAQG
jgi:hypothetical protein